MKKVLLLLAAAAITTMVSAQHFKVVKTQRFDAGSGMYHPVFTPDGKSLLVSSEDYNGLSVFDMTTKKLTSLTKMAGAGWLPEISADGRSVVCKEMHATEQKVTLHSIDLATKASTTLASRIDHVNNVNLVDNKVQYAPLGSGMLTKQFTARKVSTKAVGSSVYATTEDLKVVVYRNGVRNELKLNTANGDEDLYCWVSLSPDKSKVVFSGKRGTFTCNLDGSGLTYLGRFFAPVWCGNDYIVGHNTASDDGYVISRGDIVVVPAKGGKIQQLTTSNSELKMFPSANAEGNRIAYHTGDGKICVMTIEKL
ncbi:MAG: hypothetical protein IJS19_01060 [Muribaculaceae bacterium]|nr:hypothetical protein [Muribaculaceae bacterium]MBQ7211253.1 hypothetical protein [Muribaculaceae bacterium]